MTHSIRLSHAFLALCLLVVPATAPAQSSDAGATWIEPGEIVRGLGRAAGEPDCYRLATPGPGLLLLDATVPARAGTEPLLTVAEGDGDFGKDTELGSLAATPARQLVEIEGPRSLLVCVGAQDPLLRLDDFMLVTAFAPVTPGKDELIEVEPDESGYATGPWREKDELIEVEPDEFVTTVCPGREKDELIEVEPDESGFAAGALEELCRQVRRDDHPDVLPCATRLELGRSVAGEIANAWGDDPDVFAFELAAPETVRLWLASEAETAVSLYDSRGRRLALAGEGTSGAPAWRRVTTLGPGSYFLRVQGWQGAGGAYELEVMALPRSW